MTTAKGFQVSLPMLVLAECLLLLGCNKSDSNNRTDSAPSPNPVVNPVKSDSDFVVSAHEFAAEHRKDPYRKTLKAKYAGKQIELVGVVTRIGRAITEDDFLMLD